MSMEQSKNKKTMLTIIGIAILVIGLVGVTYAFFNYTRTGSANTIRVGKINFVTRQTNTINLINLFPIDPTDSSAMNDNTKVGTLVVEIEGDSDYSDGVEYLVSAVNSNITINNKVLPISLDVTVTTLGTESSSYWTARNSKNATIYKKLVGETLEGDQQILVGYIKPNTTSGTAEGVDGSITIKAYLDDNKILISDTYDGTESDNMGTPNSIAEGKTVFTTQEWNSLQQDGVSFQIKVEANEGVWVDGPLTADKMVRRAIVAKEADINVQCSSITYEEDGITYLSGTNDCVDMNYVWYSGKLWRITAIYPDGAMKLVTENNITSIRYNASSQVNFYTDENTTSYMYQWLNEDFYDTLYNANNIIDNTKRWNATKPANSVIRTKPAETNMITANVGLLNNYEYYNSYRCIGSSACTGTSYSTGYLNIGYQWWLLNPYNASYIWVISGDGIGEDGYPGNTFGARPSIYLKSGLTFNGMGTKQSPYKIVGDKDTGIANELVNTRMSGEYIKLKNGNNEQVFRIIGVEENKTKIIAIDYADNKAMRLFALHNSNGDGTIYGAGTTATQGEDTCYNYLTGTYEPNLETTYGQIFDSSTYYMGQVGNSQSYKLGICQDANSPTKICTKTSQVGTFNVGLPRYGEMFATPQDGGSSNSASMWLINRYSESEVSSVARDGYGNALYPTYAIGSGIRPTLHLKSTVKILSGSGTKNDPYVVGI